MFRSIVTISALLLISLTANACRFIQVPQQRFVVLDGDTVVVDGSAFRVAGIDAPELGPWAKCWAEAALAGVARENLQRLLADTNRRGWSLEEWFEDAPNRGWQLRDVSKADALGRKTARLIDRDGYDIIDDMIVYGYAARTTGRWNWCGQEANLHDLLEDERPPHGPNLWWPTAHMFDARAAD